MFNITQMHIFWVFYKFAKKNGLVEPVMPCLFIVVFQAKHWFTMVVNSRIMVLKALQSKYPGAVDARCGPDTLGFVDQLCFVRPKKFYL